MDIKKLNEKFKNAKLIKELEINLEATIARNLEIDATDLDGEVVMMNMEKGEYFMMNEVGSRIWEIIEEPRTVTSVINILLSEFEVEEKDCKETVIEFLTNLKGAELISVN
ncbi:MAG: lasso peptide biosynthesis PqqD family chaperone [Clostridium sp.]|uniref:lasso peptide biosynthesis PqqD family chaperone n=1 Tax=Clostridium sp. TaxID=1506 RepID=UPI00302AD7A3